MDNFEITINNFIFNFEEHIGEKEVKKQVAKRSANRQGEIFKLLMCGYSQKDICNFLQIGRATYFRYYAKIKLQYNIKELSRTIAQYHIARFNRYKEHVEKNYIRKEL